MPSAYHLDMTDTLSLVDICKSYWSVKQVYSVVYKKKKNSSSEPDDLLHVFCFGCCLMHCINQFYVKIICDDFNPVFLFAPIFQERWSNADYYFHI